MRLPIDFGAAGGWVPADRILPLGSRCLEAGISRAAAIHVPIYEHDGSAARSGDLPN